MSSFTFNGVSSDTLGLIITRPIVRPTWRPETEFTPIIGRPRKSPYTKSYYENVKMTVRAVITDTSQENIRDIYNVLRDYHRLFISTSPNEFLNAYCRLPVPEAQALNIAELPIEFECEPFAYKSVVPLRQDITAATNYTEIDNAGTVFSDPEIVFKPSKSATVFDCNAKTITVRTPQAIIDDNYSQDYSVHIDCDGELAYYVTPGDAKIGCTELTSGPFPRLHSGENYIKHDGVNDAFIDYWERFF